jgi:hypothetical protein
VVKPENKMVDNRQQNYIKEETISTNVMISLSDSKVQLDVFP